MLCDRAHPAKQIVGAPHSRFAIEALQDLQADIQRNLRVFAEKGLLV